MKNLTNIFLVRHGESEANVNRTLGQTKPDHAIELTDRGSAQARAAGQFLHRTYSDMHRETIPHCRPRVRMWASPYLRTRQTADYVQRSMKPAELPLLKFDQKEHINLVEQQFGLFDGIPDADLPIRYPAEHAHYKLAEDHQGRFWARMPCGESRFDVAMRVHQFFDTLQRDVRDNSIYDLIVVAHGVTIRAIMMQAFNLPYEWFENEPNPGNGSIRHIHRGEDMGYIFNPENVS